MKKNKGVTLLELMVITIIIGVLATLGITHLGSYRERLFDEEAEASLRLIHAAERIYFMEIQSYYPSAGSESGVANINLNLRLDLNTTNWNYTTWDTGCGQAVRAGDDGRIWHMCISGETDPASGSCTAACP